MSGGYSHITIAQYAIEEAMHRREGLLHSDAKQALGFFKKFVIVGALAPDYPYLDVLDSQSTEWADRVHHGKAVDLLRAGVTKVRAQQDDNARHKCLAWLFGFASHVAVDGTIHPVVNLKVGPYEQNKTNHRVCEMNQDVYAHRKLHLGPLNHNQQISINVKDTGDPANSNHFDPTVGALWEELLAETYPGNTAPKINDWHQGMRRMMDFAERNDRLFAFARHVAADQGLVYPDEPNYEKYIDNLETPNGWLPYEDIFQKAIDNVVEVWGWLALSMQAQPSPLDSLKSWSLDTGIDEVEKMVYWSSL